MNLWKKGIFESNLGSFEINTNELKRGEIFDQWIKIGKETLEIRLKIEYFYQNYVASLEEKEPNHIGINLQKKIEFNYHRVLDFLVFSLMSPVHFSFEKSDEWFLNEYKERYFISDFYFSLVKLEQILIYFSDNQSYFEMLNFQLAELKASFGSKLSIKTNSERARYKTVCEKIKNVVKKNCKKNKKIKKYFCFKTLTKNKKKTKKKQTKKIF